jgi:2-oxoglutarate ferredoxin oxidoreductase subunit gamma
MERRVLIAGSGGQGIIFMGEILSSASMLDGKEVTSFPSYGVEKIGGFARCLVIVSDEMIGSPVSDLVDILIAMNQWALEKFTQKLEPDGLILYDSLLRGPEPKEPTIKTYQVPAAERALSHNTLKGSNMVMLGAFAAITKLVKLKSLLKAIESRTPEHRIDSIELNKRLITEGYRLFEDKKG